MLRRRNILNTSGPEYSADVQAYFAAIASVGPAASATEKEAVNTLIVDLKAANLFSEFVRLWLRSPASEAASLIDFITLESSVAVNAPTWATTGFTYDGATNYVDMVAQLNQLGLTINDCTYGFYLRSGTAGPLTYAFGANQSSSGRPNFIRFNGSLFEYTAGQLAGIASAAHGTVAGLFCGSTDSSSVPITRRIFKNGDLKNENIIGTSGQYTTKPAFFGANNNNGTANFHFAGEECFGFIATNFTTSEHATLYSLIQTYQTNVIAGGRQV